MPDKRKFRVGDRVRPSADGIAGNIFQPEHHKAWGTVVKVDEFNFPTVLWDHRKTASRYHPDFIKQEKPNG